MLYAAGEVLLVIVGIVIALQIDNWNQDRQEQTQIAEYARALIIDLEADIEMVDPIIIQTKKIGALADGLADYMRGRQLEDVRNLDLYYLTDMTTYRPFSWNRAAIQQLMSSGSLRQIKNMNLVREISEYDAFTRHLDEDYASDRTAGERAKSAAMAVVDGNYPKVEEGIDSLQWSAAYSFPPSDLYEAYRDIDLQLLTDDISKIKEMVNLFGPLASVGRIRSNQELPRLQERARSLIELLQAEYEQ